MYLVTRAPSTWKSEVAMHMSNDNDSQRSGFSTRVLLTMIVGALALLAMLFVDQGPDGLGRRILSLVLMIVCGGSFVLVCEFRMSEMEREGKPVRPSRLFTRGLLGLCAIAGIGTQLVFLWLRVRR